MNEKFEIAGVIGTEKFPRVRQLWDGHTVYTDQSDERTVPMMFKNLPAGTQLFIKKPKDERTNSRTC